MNLRSIAATRYVTPLREGGSLPAVVEADDDGLYVLKFRGAGPGAQGARGRGRRRRARPRARLSRGARARASSSSIPAIGRAEPDAEIQDLLLASAGPNLGVDFLPGALPFRPPAGPAPSPELAAAIVWLDALVTNVDRTAQNTNLLHWHGRLWLIDHGAALYFHHGAGDLREHARRPFEAIAEHVLLPYAGSIAEADERLAPRGRRASCWSRSPPRSRTRGSTATTAASTSTTSATRLEPPRAFVATAEEARERR